jgi:SP family xylose:H+ symportor-like MFS transporter
LKNTNQNLWAFTASLAGFLFGFDTVVISGANLPIKELWNTSTWMHGAIMSMALWGTVLGSLFGSIPSQKYGRKQTLIWIGILYFVSAIGSAFAPDPYSFSFFRFIGGLGVGASTVAGPMYISEISTAHNRGRLVALYQFNIVLGILIAFFSNYLLKDFDGANDWRWMLGVEGIPAAVYFAAVLFVPKSPRWLMTVKHDEEGARQVLEKMGVNDVADELARIEQAEKAIEKTHEPFFSKYRKPVILAFLVAFFNQLSGINFVLYYAPEILEMAGLASKESLLNSIAIGGINLIFTFVGLYLIDKTGRRQLLIIGSIGYIASLLMISLSFYAELGSGILLASILAFIASHAVGQGAIIWVFIAEIFPNHVRAAGTSLGTGTHWVFAAIITFLGPVVIGVFHENPWPIFVIFAAMMVLQLLFALFMMPETKGVSLEDIQKKLGL